MTFAEIAVFQHLLPQAIRTERLAKQLGFPIGFCPHATGNRIAAEMGKSRQAVHRALRGLEWNDQTQRRYITRYPASAGILIHNFTGDGVAGIQPGREYSRLGNGPGVAGKQSGGGCDPVRRRTAFQPPIKEAIRDTGNVDTRARVEGGLHSSRPHSRTEDSEFWASLLEQVAARISPHTFHTWFRPLALLEVDHGRKVLIVSAPNEHFRDWLSQEYSGVIRDALEELERSDFRVVFETAEVTA